MIHSITIKGFRGIESGQIRKLTSFNVFVGANNAGKSTVMEALYLASTANQKAGLITQQDKEIITYDVLLPGHDLLGCPALKSVTTKHSDTIESSVLGWVEPGSIKVNVLDQSAPESLQQFELSLRALGPSTPKASNIALFSLDSLPQPETLSEDENDLYKQRMTLIQQLIDHSVEPTHPTRTVFCWYPDLTYYTKGSASWMTEGTPPAAQHTLFCDTSMVQSYIPIAFYRQILSTVPGWTQRIAEHFAAIYDLDSKSNIQFVPLRGDEQKLQGWLAQKDRPALAIDAFGDGARAAFKLLAPLVAMAEMVTPEAPGLLLWEEPESFQNPRTLGRLLEEVVNIIRDKPIQVFISTHSLEFVAYVTQMLQDGRIKTENTRLFQMNLFNGHLKSTWFDKGNLVSWLESGIDPRVWDDFVPPLQFHLREEQV